MNTTSPKAKRPTASPLETLHAQLTKADFSAIPKLVGERRGLLGTASEHYQNLVGRLVAKCEQLAEVNERVHRLEANLAREIQLKRGLLSLAKADGRAEPTFNL